LGCEPFRPWRSRIVELLELLGVGEVLKPADGSLVLDELCLADDR